MSRSMCASFRIAALLCLLTLCSTGTLIPASFLDKVVAIGRKEIDPNTGRQRWIPEASGFIYGDFISKADEQNNNYATYLVTNRHVVEGHAKMSPNPLSVKFNLKAEGLARDYEIPLRDEKNKPTWHFHPNPSIDVAVIRINPDFLAKEQARFAPFRSDLDVLTRAHANELGLAEGDSIFVMGFPMGLVGEHQDYVIVRQGAIARVRDGLADLTQETFLIDSLIFPGNSGGPVILRPEMVSVQGEKPAINRTYLLGMIKDYRPYTDLAISAQTLRPRVTFEENSGLTDVIFADYIDETIADYKQSRIK